METWRLPDGLWAVMESLLAEPPPHPWGGRPFVASRCAMEAIWFVMRTGCPWRALNAKSLCSSATAERRFREWKRAGVFERLHERCLEIADAAGAIDWSFLAVDGCHVKAPLSRTEKGGRSSRPPSHEAILRGGSGELAERQREAIAAALKAELARHETPEGIVMQSSSWMVSARNPG